MGQIIGNDRVNRDPCTPEQEAKNDNVLQTQVDVINTTLETIVAGTSDHKFSVKSDGSDTADFAISKVDPVAAPVAGDLQAFFQESGGNLEAFISAADITALVGSGVSDHKVSLDATDESGSGYGYLTAKVSPINTKLAGDVTVHFNQATSKLIAFVSQSDILTAVGGSATVVAEGNYIDVTNAGSTYTVAVDPTEFPGYDATSIQFLVNLAGTFEWCTPSSYNGSTKQFLTHTNTGQLQWATSPVRTPTTIQIPTGITLSIVAGNLVVTLAYKNYTADVDDLSTSNTFTGSIATSTECPAP